MLFVFHAGRRIDLNGAFVSKVGTPITVSLFESLSFCRQNIGFSICHIYLSLSCMNSFIHSKLIHDSSQAKSQEDYFYEIDKLRPTLPILFYFILFYYILFFSISEISYKLLRFLIYGFIVKFDNEIGKVLSFGMPQLHSAY